MRFKRRKRVYVIDPTTGIFGGASQLARQRKRLFLTTLRWGQGFTELLKMWAPLHGAALTQRAKEYEVETGRPPASELQLRSLAWRAWRDANNEAADAFTLGHFGGVWEAFEATQQATFLAITHALSREALLGELDRVMYINGDGKGAGTSRFRLFVVLKPTALKAIWDKWGKPDLDSIHPGYPTSFRQQEDDPPRLQVSTREIPSKNKTLQISHWVKNTDHWADIDIDYRAFGEGHLMASNSDVTGKVPYKKALHIDRHAKAYGNLPGLRRA